MICVYLELQKDPSSFYNFKFHHTILQHRVGLWTSIWYYYILPIRTPLDLIWRLNWEKGYSKNLIQERNIMDLRGIFSLMASQQAIKKKNSHEWIDIVTKTEELQIFWKTTQASNSREIFKNNYTRALRSFQPSSSVI
jgi:hypothetical protein